MPFETFKHKKPTQKLSQIRQVFSETGQVFQLVCGSSKTDPFRAEGHVSGTNDPMELKFGLVQLNWNSLPPPVQYCKKVTLKQGIKEVYQND